MADYMHKMHADDFIAIRIITIFDQERPFNLGGRGARFQAGRIKI